MQRLSTFLATALLFLVAGGELAWGQYDRMSVGPHGWLFGPGVSAAFYVEQRHWPTGYGIRLHLPKNRTTDIDISVDGTSLVIRSKAGTQVAPRGPMGPVFMQFGGFSQQLTLPLNADTSKMKVNNHYGTIEIFIPKHH